MIMIIMIIIIIIITIITRNTIFAVTLEARLDFLVLVYSALGRTHKPHKSRLASIRNMLALFSH